MAKRKRKTEDEMKEDFEAGTGNELPNPLRQAEDDKT
jgi:hypothetical protein